MSALASIAHTPPSRFSQAERHIQARGTRFTAIRRAVFRQLLDAGSPIGAYDILEVLPDVGSRRPPTVYRALNWLIEQGVAAKLSFNNRYVAIDPDAQSGAMAFLICQACGSASPISADGPATALTRQAETHGFSQVAPVIELIGVCSDNVCAQTIEKERAA